MLSKLKYRYLIILLLSIDSIYSLEIENSLGAAIEVVHNSSLDKRGFHEESPLFQYIEDDSLSEYFKSPPYYPSRSFYPFI
ncbi:hypothetical protein DFJ63DRAFT_221455 [Scheffersomyces coipomensis]|uniref:uncharacterized protein n=1 Tax=Scheffersomyces coipomensis TaxID=1788519 RepID=UPI00315D360E